MLILLIGPEGSGKTHVGRLLEQRLDVRFLHVEPHWLDWQTECRAAGREPDITVAYTRGKTVFIERVMEVERIAG